MRPHSALLCACLAATSLGSRAADKLVPVEAFVEPQQFSNPRLAPDGKHLAVSVRLKRGDRTVPTMTIYSLPELKIVNTIILPGFEIPIDFLWLNNRRLVVEKGLEVGERERPQATGEVLAVDFDGSKQEYLYGYNNFKQSSRGDRYGDDYGWGTLTHIPYSRDGHLLLGTHQWDGHRSMLYDINSTNSVRRLLADIPMKSFDFTVQNDGTPRFAHGWDDNYKPVLFRRDDASGEWNRVDPKTLGAGYGPIAFTADDSAFYAYYSAHGGPYALVREDLRSGARTTLAEDPLSSFDDIEYTARPWVPFAVSNDIGIPKARYIDPAAPDAQLHKTLSALFPDSYVHFINFTDDGQKLLFSARSDRDPGSFYLYDRASGKADMLMINMPDIEPALMGERRPVVFTARDGEQITGYLTLPHNRGANKLPLVLLPHGGPFEVSDDWYFDPDAQFLASRGYAVLQVNFRGSAGRGVRFLYAGYRQWGGKIIDDLVDGVQWATALPDIDRDRVCVYGSSFGGYAAMMAPVRAPSMFKCAVGYSGRYDLPSKYDEESVKGEAQANAYLAKTLGTDRAELEANSPTHLADKIKLPVMLVHGNKDKTTGLAQAEMMRDALIKAGNPPEWILVKNEGHGFYDAEHRKDFYLRLVAFLDKYIGKPASDKQ
jgi:dienelactone hydrolase